MSKTTASQTGSAKRKTVPDPALMSAYPRIDDLIATARRRVPRFVWGFLSYGAGRETALDANVRAFDSVQLTPRYFSGSDRVDTSAMILGQRHGLPFGVAPIGLASLIWPQAERHMAQAAAKAGIPMVLSTVAGASVESIADVAPEHTWFQLYTPRDPEVRDDLMARAGAAGVKTLVVSVEVPVASRREGALIDGLPAQGSLTPRTALQSALHPTWALSMLFQGRAHIAGMERYVSSPSSAEVWKFVGRQVLRRISLSELEDIRARWPHALVVKGLMSVEEVQSALAAGCDAVWLSNHGARQSDAIAPPLSVLSGIRRAVGPEPELYLDSGVRSGLDVLRALHLGADFVFLGRPFLYGLAALGGRGPQHVIDIVTDELTQSLRQFGFPDVRSVRAP